MTRVSILPLVLAAALSGPGFGQDSDRFGDDAAFLQKHTDAVVLEEPGRSGKIVVVPAYQGRVMTSTTGGDSGASLGWINHAHIASGEFVPQFNPFGGEERLWIAPEGGQFSIFFYPGASFEVANWRTPPSLDTEPFQTVSKDADRIALTKTTTLTNYSGTTFRVKVDRTVRVVTRAEIAKALDVKLANATRCVGYKSANVLTNAGNAPWKKSTGLLAVWILGQYKASPSATVVVPYVTGPESELGSIVEDSYFGEIPTNRLRAKEGFVFFKADGQARGKIGLSANRAKDVLGSYDPAIGVLTIVRYNKPTDTKEYLNNLWRITEKPFSGAAIMSYNDGPLAPGEKQLGPFYELESASPARELMPGASIRHVHETFHFEANEGDLDAICQSVLGLSLERILTAFAD